MDKRVITIGVVVLLLVLVGGGAFFVLSKRETSPITPTPAPSQMVVPTLTPDDIGLTFIASPNKKQVKFEITNTQGLQTIDYEITYEADSPEDSDIKIPRGTGGENIHIDQSKGTFATEWIDLGSCSSGTCKYYKGITEIKLLVKVTKTDGTVHQVEDILRL